MTRDSPQSGRSVFPVVAIGASAGGLEACQRLFDGIPGKTGMAFVLIQHLDPRHVSMMADLLAGHTAMTVIQASEGMRVEADHLYLIPPGMLMTLAKGSLHLVPTPAGQAQRLPFDHFLRSMAPELGPRAVAVVLTGSGADGSSALAAIRDAGGLVLVQDPADAAFDGMPSAAMTTGQATFVAPLAELALALIAHSKELPPRPATTAAPGALADIIGLLRGSKKHDFTHYKTGTLQRRIEQRTTLLRLAPGDLGAYQALLQTDPGEVDRLSKSLLIHVTEFFRDAEVFDLLRAEIVPALVQNRQDAKPIRIWVAGCSTGQEAYSLGILFQEAITASNARCDVQIFASDIDDDALAIARDGFYRDTAGLSPEHLALHFMREGEGFRVKPELRSLVTFARHDVLTDPPFAHLDLLSCRNLMIYLSPEAQEQVLESFHFALVSGGLLLLGKAETAIGPGLRFDTLAEGGRIYRNRARARPGRGGTAAAPASAGALRMAGGMPQDRTGPVPDPKHFDAQVPRERAATPPEVASSVTARVGTPQDLRTELAETRRALEREQEARRAQREEALSISEEYQAANEELLASKEELQALNEELSALNGQLEETLDQQRSTANDLQNVLYSTNVATLFLDPDLCIRFFTPATRALFNMRQGDIGRPLADLAPLSSDNLLLSDARRILAGAPQVECEVEAQEGTWFSRRILPYLTDTGDIAGVVITFSEITERRKISKALAAAEAAAQRANNAKTRFLMVASHDLRQPLQSMVILKDLLIGATSGPRGTDLVKRLGETLNAMARMLDVLLDINQIEAGAIRPEKSVFRIDDIFDRLLTDFSYTAQAKNLDLRLVRSSLEVYSDPILIEQMLRNLLSNALKYTRKGKVLVGCRRREGKVVAEVWDTGIGIAESEIQAIFEEYHQVNNAARERSLGLGLGLNIVQRLGAMLGHRIGAVSTPGHGSVFSIEIEAAVPDQVVQLASATGYPPKPVAIASDKACILIVEDDPEVRSLLELVLREQGHETVSAEDGPSALARVAEGAIRPDLVLTDFNLPGGLDGMALAEELRRAEKRDLPAIMLTGDISRLAMQRISQENVLHLAKPVSVERLNRAIVELLGPPSQAAEPPVPIARAPPKSKDAADRATVFLVDDDAPLRLSLCQMLREAGHVVQDYASAEAFLDDHVPGAAGCLLIDAYLPGMSGLALLQHLQALPEPPVSIMITGRSDVAIAVAAMKAGAVDFIEKPVTGADLLARIEEGLRRARTVGADSAGKDRQRARLAALTPRQREVLDSVLAGKASKVIAYDLGISQRTVESHRAAIMERLGAKSVPELVRLVLGAG